MLFQFGSGSAQYGEGVGDQPHRRPRRVDVGAARHVLLQDVVLDGAAQHCRTPRPARRPPTRRAGAGSAAVALIVIDVVTLSSGRPASSSRMSASESMATPTLPTSPSARAWSESSPICVGRSKAHDRPGLPRRQQELEALVGVLGGAEPGVLAHRPQPAPVHARVDAPRVGRRPGLARAWRRGPSPRGPPALYSGRTSMPESVRRASSLTLSQVTD